jgi:hypothetical protein
MSLGYHDLWGYDPLVLRRYAELMFAAQNYDPDGASQNLALRMPPPKSIGVLRMLRTALVLAPEARTPVYNVPQPLGVTALVGSWVELNERDSIFAFLLREEFDPARVAVIERPLPKEMTQALTTAPPGAVELLGSDTDGLELRATLDRPALLLVTNNFAAGWRVRNLSPSPSQRDYELMRANYVLQAVPLRSGSHHFRIEYAPREFRIGTWITILALVLFMIALAAQLLRPARMNLLMHPLRWFR